MGVGLALGACLGAAHDFSRLAAPHGAAYFQSMLSRDGMSLPHSLQALVSCVHRSRHASPESRTALLKLLFCLEPFLLCLGSYSHLVNFNATAPASACRDQSSSTCFCSVKE